MRPRRLPKVETKRTKLSTVPVCRFCKVAGQYDQDGHLFIRHHVDCIVWCGCCGQYYKRMTGGLCVVCEFALSTFSDTELDKLYELTLGEANDLLLERLAIMEKAGEINGYFP